VDEATIENSEARSEEKGMKNAQKVAILEEATGDE
jgi:hypothetical protein